MADYCHIPSLVQVAGPAIEPLTLAETKLYLRVDSGAEDSLISGLITSAREMAENYTKRSFITQSWCLSYDHYAPKRVMLPRPPIQSVTSVNVINCDGSQQAFTNFYLGALGDQLIFDAIPLGAIIEITYQAGYGSAESAVPQALRTGMLTHIADMYEDRSGSAAISGRTAALYDSYKVVKI